jgi:hypothetical protein
MCACVCVYLCVCVRAQQPAGGGGGGGGRRGESAVAADHVPYHTATKAARDLPYQALAARDLPYQALASSSSSSRGGVGIDPYKASALVAANLSSNTEQDAKHMSPDMPLSSHKQMTSDFDTDKPSQPPRGGGGGGGGGMQASQPLVIFSQRSGMGVDGSGALREESTVREGEGWRGGAKQSEGGGGGGGGGGGMQGESIQRFKSQLQRVRNLSRNNTQSGSPGNPLLTSEYLAWKRDVQSDVKLPAVQGLDLGV